MPRALIRNEQIKEFIDITGAPGKLEFNIITMDGQKFPGKINLKESQLDNCARKRLYKLVKNASNI
jgi:hypothetical protein